MAYQTQQYESGTSDVSYGMDAANQLGLSPTRVFKTLIAQTNRDELIVAIVPVTGQLHLKSLAAAVGAKKAAMADAARVEKTTGYVLGGVSPLGQKKRLRTVIDTSARDHAIIHVSGGRRGLEISLAPSDLATLTGASYAFIADIQG